ncbi:hypothetical protein SAMN06265222_101385 [Neorhodopirellula lusitana]|uniref:Signal peptidase I n=2 Tax=Neorhodopirellula lusitana TaxID=445327 RepID=A0ABY1PS50_9BACT|nr:hypothetical protein SAMN06265222_101385 [Neorhodopirellula lusitana]
MNPTLWAASVRVRCVDCQIESRVDRSIWQRAVAAGQTVCWHCGSKQAGTITEELPPDVVRLLASAGRDRNTPWHGAKYQSGDLVLVRKTLGGSEDGPGVGGDMHVKRVLAGPGQTVSVDDSRLLLVDGMRPDFPGLPKVLVDSDSHRGGLHAEGDSRWQRAANGWTVYQHVSVYRAGRPIPVMDDYPGNVGLARRLRPARRLSLVFSVPSNWSHGNAEGSWNLQCRWWTGRGFVEQSLTENQWNAVGRGKSAIRFRQPITLPNAAPAGRSVTTGDRPLPSTSALRTSLPSISSSSDAKASLVSPSRPVALRLTFSGVKSGEVDSDSGARVFPDFRPDALRLERDVQYAVGAVNVLGRSAAMTDPRVIPTEDQEKMHPQQDGLRLVVYPVELGSAEYFIVGDNVPFSVDSRHFGPVEEKEVLGRVSKEGVK